MSKKSKIEEEEREHEMHETITDDGRFAEAEETGYSYTWRWTQRVANSLGLDVLYLVSRQHSIEAGRLGTG